MTLLFVILAEFIFADNFVYSLGYNLIMEHNLTLLGGLSVKEFLRDYWQKKPLLIRQALPGFKGLLDPQQLMALACTQDAQARLVTHKRGLWQLQQGPFEAGDFARHGKSKWTMLVQGVNHSLPQAAELLKQFSFIPHARLDDLMVSYAPKDGGVGPHFDSYDVFLLQGLGHRRWQISGQADRTLIEGAPLRILQNFTVEQEWVLEPGDMLYLPPHWAHNGIAEDDCMTYSIGFRTPSYQELGEQFLVYLQDNICLDGMYADPDLKAQTHPSEISADMLRQVENAINQIKWGKPDIASFLGSYLSEPKPHIFFDPPEKPWTRKRFQQSVQKLGIALDLKTQMLCHNYTVFINGEAHCVDKESYLHLRALADERQLDAGANLATAAMDLLYQWYTDGYIIPFSDTKQASN
jgi:50S ribosomal protein L16 3-hydroxylase